MKRRYKLTKEQLEMVVESFVSEKSTKKPVVENSEEHVEEGWGSNIMYSVAGSYPKIEKMVSELGKKKDKNPEGYQQVLSALKRYSNVEDQISLIKPAQSDKTFPYTEENFMALAGFHNFNIDVLKPVERKGTYIIPLKVKSGVGSVTGHSK